MTQFIHRQQNNRTLRKEFVQCLELSIQHAVQRL